MNYKYFTPEQVAEIKQQVNTLLDTKAKQAFYKQLNGLTDDGIDLNDVGKHYLGEFFKLRLDAIPNSTIEIAVEAIATKPYLDNNYEYDEYGREYGAEFILFGDYELYDIYTGDFYFDDDRDVDDDYRKELEHIIEHC